MSLERPLTARDLAHPVDFLALGFGSGLSPRAPGTVGSLAALPVWWLISGLDVATYAAVSIALALAGIYICDACARRLGVHDHPGIVFDEIVGVLFTMFALPATLGWAIAGFVVFRILDILKPWPISVLDRRLGGGFGIMVDDLVAGALACAILHVARVALGA